MRVEQVLGNGFSVQRLRHFQPACLPLNDENANRGFVSSLASDAVENLCFFVPVGFDLNQLLGELALFIFGAADGRDDPVSLLSSQTLVKAGKREQLWLGFRDRVLGGKKINKLR